MRRQTEHEVAEEGMERWPRANACGQSSAAPRPLQVPPLGTATAPHALVKVAEKMASVSCKVTDHQISAYCCLNTEGVYYGL